jgi:cell division protein FtsB
MPAVPDPTVDTPNRSGAAQPLRRKRVPPPPTGQRRRSILQALIVFVIVVLAVDGLVGEKGLIETMQARRQYREVEASLEQLQQDNARLREKKKLLTNDPATIESVAREELGLIRPGETLFIIRDAKPAR